MRITIFLLLVLLTILHQDFWWRGDHRTLVLGFLPISLAYHIGISIASCILWGLACVYCWPRGLDVEEEETAISPSGRAH